MGVIRYVPDQKLRDPSQVIAPGSRPAPPGPSAAEPDMLSGLPPAPAPSPEPTPAQAPAPAPAPVQVNGSQPRSSLGTQPAPPAPATARPPRETAPPAPTPSAPAPQLRPRRAPGPPRRTHFLTATPRRRRAPRTRLLTATLGRRPRPRCRRWPAATSRRRAVTSTTTSPSLNGPGGRTAGGGHW